MHFKLPIRRCGGESSVIIPELITRLSLDVDGREISWDDFGRMLMTFEGWQLKMEIRDNSEYL